MPGLLGFTKRAFESDDYIGVLKKMQRVVTYYPCYLVDRIFEDRNLCATRVTNGIINKELQPYTKNNVHIWLDGEFYNRSSFQKNFTSDLSLLCEYYRNGELIQFLRRVDGIFSSVIYDQKNQSLKIITDRFGLRHLFLRRSENGYIWASEIKPFLFIPSYSPSVTPGSVDQFIKEGHFCGSVTWFSDVRLIEPATIITIDLKTNKAVSNSYWSVNEIRRPAQRLSDIDEMAHEAGRLLKKAVNKRCDPGESIGISLSGGLDSRALLAAFPQDHTPSPQTLTFGSPDCLDVRIAKKVAAIRNYPHTVHVIDENNWMTNRCKGVWWTDGQFNLIHMHGIEQLNAIKNLYHIELNGFLGDAILGGTYIRGNNGMQNMFRDRGRRFIAMGLVIGNALIHTRIPFMDNDLYEFTLTVPERFLKNGFFYKKVLLHTFPDFFSGIPWQKTGLPITRNNCQVFLKYSFERVLDKISTILPITPRNRSFTNYSNLLCTQTSRILLEKLFNNNDALIFNYVDPVKIRTHIVQSKNGIDKSEIVGRYMTLEIWLRQIAEKNCISIDELLC
ncbi:MAG TPA: asparagine synthase-related protein [Chitinispirillaceae bacterium]|nr:asparagine synthase-related protein [Chitinispirillaceae bacterium]